MDRMDGSRQRAHRASTIATALQLLAAHDPDRAEELERQLGQTGDPETRRALRETLAEALFEHDQDEAAVEVLCT